MNRFILFCAGVCSGVVILTAIVYNQIHAGDEFNDPLQIVGERDLTPEEIIFKPEIDALVRPVDGGFRVDAQANLLTTEPLDVALVWHVAIYNDTANYVVRKHTYNNESFVINPNEPKLAEFSDGYRLPPGNYIVFVALRQFDGEEGKSLVGQSYDLVIE